MDKIFDLAIIGSGPAGMTAAIYAKRAGLDVVVFEGSAPGGKLVKTFEIDNWPGEPNISGVTLAMKMYEHTTNLEVLTEYTNVVELINDRVKQLKTEDGRVFKTKAVIIASGTIENMMNIPGEESMIGKGVSFCAVCDGAFYKEKEVVVIGGGNSALEESLYLTQFAQKVTIILRRDVFRGDVQAQERVFANPKINIIYSHVPVAVEHGVKVTGLKIQSVLDKSEKIVSCDGIFPYIGAKPSTQCVSTLGITDKEGYMSVNEKMETIIPGIYGAGDVVVKPLRQIVTAVNDGAIAAQTAFHYIKEFD
jgi:thioredoxin reductase (NADPH)